MLGTLSRAADKSKCYTREICFSILSIHVTYFLIEFIDNLCIVADKIY